MLDKFSLIRNVGKFDSVNAGANLVKALRVLQKNMQFMTIKVLVAIA